MGKVTKEEAFAILDYYHDQGGNFLDTASNYQSEQSETWIGEWMASRPGLRDEMVVATKYSFYFTTYKGHDKILQSNFGGNNAKSMRLSLDASLKKLQTDYIDVFYVHWWDSTTSIPELMHSLNTFVEQGKVLYLGVSDTPAWIVSKANEYARGKGLRQFSVYQGLWNAAMRDFERDILPMCAAEGMGIVPWGVVGRGNFKSEKQRETSKGEGRQMGGPSEADFKVSKVLEKLADAKGTAITSIALAYIIQKVPYVFPLVGVRKIEHLKGNIEALGVTLTDDDVQEIEGATDFDVGFPLNFISSRPGGPRGPEDIWLSDLGGKFDYVEGPKVGCPLLMRSSTSPFFGGERGELFQSWMTTNRNFPSLTFSRPSVPILTNPPHDPIHDIIGPFRNRWVHTHSLPNPVQSHDGGSASSIKHVELYYQKKKVLLPFFNYRT